MVRLQAAGVTRGRMIYTDSAETVRVQLLEIGGVLRHAEMILDNDNSITFPTNQIDRLQIDANATAAETSLLVYSVDDAALLRVSVGAADSGGAGFRLLRIPN